MGVDTEGEPLPTREAAPGEHGKVCELVMLVALKSEGLSAINTLFQYIRSSRNLTFCEK